MNDTNPPFLPRFRPQRPREWPRVAVGVLFLLHVASPWLSLIARFGSRDAVHWWEHRWARGVRWLLGVELEIDGFENIDPNEKYVVVSLHEGLFDPVALFHLPLPLRFLVRDELFTWPLLRRYLLASQQIRVDTHPDRTSLRRLFSEAAEVLSGGDSLVVFAQGSVLGLEVAFAQGADRLARALKRPILPVVITGTHRVWEHPYSPTVRTGIRVSMRVLKPVSPENPLDGLRELEQLMKRVAMGPGMAPVRRFVPERDGWWDGYRYEIDPDFEDLEARVRAHRAAHPHREPVDVTEEII